jgi:hypothetical protein
VALTIFLLLALLDGGVVMVLRAGPEDRTVLLGALERVLYEGCKEALAASLKFECRCGAEVGEWCAGVPWPHAARLKRGVRLAIRDNVRE